MTIDLARIDAAAVPPTSTRRVLEDHPIDTDLDAFDRFHAFHDPQRLHELDTLDALDDEGPVHQLDDLDRSRRSQTRRGGLSLGFACSIIGRVMVVGLLVLIVLTIAPFGRPESSSIVAGGRAQQADSAIGPVATRALVSTTTSTVVAFADVRSAALPLQIDLAGIAQTVDPEELGYEPDPGGWVEPSIEPESEWIDGGNGVDLPDLLLRVRFCESSNNYQAAHVTSTARGAYQFLTMSWEWYGHAERYGVPQAHLATPAQQDEAALLTYRESGARPWAESRHCWDSPDIDPRYISTRPPAQAPTTTAAASDATVPPADEETTTTAAGSTTSGADSETTAESSTTAGE